jgi:hypothetical protein
MIIIARKTGRLGNRLKLFSHFIALACEHDLQICNPSFYKYAHLFQGTANSSLLCSFPNATPRTKPPSPLHRGLFYNLLHCGMEVSSKTGCFTISGRLHIKLREISLGQFEDISRPEFVEQARHETLFVRGYGYRCEKLVAKHKPKILEFFRPIAQYERSVDELTGPLLNNRNEDDVLVGLHIRHGDFATYLDGRYFYSIDQYKSVMRQIESLMPNRRVRFLIATNAEISPADFSGFDATVSGQSPLVDMYSLAKCDYLVGPPSTFTTWASFYGDVPMHHIVDPNASISLTDFIVHDEDRVITDPLAITA